MREAEFQKWITQVADLTGWRWWHVPAPMVARGQNWVGAKQAAGLPDLFLLHDDPPRLLILEVKGTGGRLSAEQQDFLQRAKLVADRAIDRDDADYTDSQESVYVGSAVVGVHTVWPGQEEQIERMLRTKVVT